MLLRSRVTHRDGGAGRTRTRRAVSLRPGVFLVEALEERLLLTGTITPPTVPPAVSTANSLAQPNTQPGPTGDNITLTGQVGPTAAPVTFQVPLDPEVSSLTLGFNWSAAPFSPSGRMVVTDDAGDVLARLALTGPTESVTIPLSSAAGLSAASVSVKVFPNHNADKAGPAGFSLTVTKTRPSTSSPFFDSLNNTSTNTAPGPVSNPPPSNFSADTGFTLSGPQPVSVALPTPPPTPVCGIFGQRAVVTTPIPIAPAPTPAVGAGTTTTTPTVASAPVVIFGVFTAPSVPAAAPAAPAGGAGATAGLVGFLARSVPMLPARPTGVADAPPLNGPGRERAILPDLPVVAAYLVPGEQLGAGKSKLASTAVVAVDPPARDELASPGPFAQAPATEDGRWRPRGGIIAVSVYTSAAMILGVSAPSLTPTFQGRRKAKSDRP